MDFTLQGSPTPRTSQRHLAGNGPASRPSSGKPQLRRNPITGEEIEYDPPVSVRLTNSPRPNSRPDSVPCLNLQYLKESDKAQGKPLEIYDVSLNTPGTVSTFSTSRSQYSSRVPSAQRKSSRPADVPALSMVGDGHQIHSHRAKATHSYKNKTTFIPFSTTSKPPWHYISDQHAGMFQLQGPEFSKCLSYRKSPKTSPSDEFASNMNLRILLIIESV
ncbi:uncharacterized protein LOC135463045 [Liolophura sinensis]|uniref:uncharacterized protein LOC135463045 n=1 Tax=Liolophura sinensis TaxID=3198878 RepID=UPI00315916C9